MKIETEMNLHDNIYYAKVFQTNVWDDCLVCKGDYLNLNVEVERKNFKVRCPVCTAGKICTGKFDSEIKCLTIGQIQIKINELKKGSTNSFQLEEEYMCYETGIGSGTIHTIGKFYLFSSLASIVVKTRKEAEEFVKKYLDEFNNK